MTQRSKILALFLAFLFVLVISGIAQQQAEEKVVCPVCGHEFNKSEAKATYEYEGKTYYFCSDGCREKFMKNPENYLEKKEEMKAVYTCPMHPEVKSDKPGKCPKCGMNLEKKMMPMEHMEAHMHQEMMPKEQMDKEMMPKKCEEVACCPMMGVMNHKDIEMNVENIQDGIAVKITSKNADVVKKIQEMAAKMKEMCCKKEAEKEEVKKEEVEK
jgi:YHS domain-containing protein